MGRCCVLGCKNRPECKNSDITFHRFPKNTEIRDLWIARTGRSNWQPPQSARICSKHFESHCFSKKKSVTYLNPDSVPNLFVHESQQILEDHHQQPMTDGDQSSETMEVAMEIEVSSNLLEVIPDTDKPSTSTSTSMKRIAMETESDVNLLEVIPETDKPSTSTSTSMNWIAMEIESDLIEEDSSLVAPAPIQITPRKKKLMTKLEIKTRLAEKRKSQLAALRAKTWRLQKKTAEMSSIIEQLRTRCMINQECADMLSSIDPVNKHFLQKFLCKDTSERKYSPELRKFALTLHFISPRAYNYVRKQFDTCLPHPRTLSRWYQCIDGNPGFCQESLEAVKLLNKMSKEKNPSQKLLCALSFDEMAIRKFVDWDGKNCFGFVNYGTNVANDQLAKEALVFMLTCVNGSWKIPLGYFLIDGISAEQKANLVQTCIKMVIAECGVDIISVTFDGCPANFAMAKILGCKLEGNDIDPSFTIDNTKVVIFPDPSHMLKLVRNTLGEKEKLTDGEGRTISWGYIKQLLELQENEGLHLGNKLNKAHVNFKKQIMKVKLAAQVFSESVANAIDFCTDELNIDSFKNSEATVEFIRKINDLFDIMNSRNMNAYANKKPIFPGNFTKQKIHLETIFEYLTQLKLDERNILYTNRKTGFLGFLICIRSVLFLYEKHVTSNSLQFLCTYKLSQDHLEYFFSAIRAKGGFNNNPTARQFRSAFKRMLVHGELKHIKTGNCVPLQEINILTYSRPEVAISKTTDRNRLIDESQINYRDGSKDIDFVTTMEDHDYLTDPSRLTEFSKQIIVYIAGFVVGKLEKEIQCGDCISAIISVEKYKSLQFKKDKGGLHYPTKDVVAICEICENIFRRNLNGGLNQKNLLHVLTQGCLKKCLNLKLFSQITQHFQNQSFIDSHFPLLIKAIAKKYFNVRIHFATKKISEKDDKVRNFYNKLVLFKGQ